VLPAIVHAADLSPITCCRSARHWHGGTLQIVVMFYFLLLLLGALLAAAAAEIS